MRVGPYRRNLEAVDEVLDPDFVCHDPNSEAGEVRGADTTKQEIEWFRNAVPTSPALWWIGQQRVTRW
jgi:hypothetical protein